MEVCKADSAEYDVSNEAAHELARSRVAAIYRLAMRTGQ